MSAKKRPSTAKPAARKAKASSSAAQPADLFAPLETTQDPTAAPASAPTDRPLPAEAQAEMETKAETGVETETKAETKAEAETAVKSAGKAKRRKAAGKTESAAVAKTATPSSAAAANAGAHSPAAPPPTLPPARAAGGGDDDEADIPSAAVVVAEPALMSMKAVATHLHLIGTLIELADDSPNANFRVRSYENAARNLEAVSGTLGDNLDSGALKTIKGIGASMLEKLRELRTSGRIAQEDELRRKIPAGLFEIMDVQGLGPKRIKLLWHELNVTSLADLEAACRDGKLESLEGFGKKTQANILASIEFHKQTQSRFHQHVAFAAANAVNEFLRAVPGVKRFEMAGSLRRRKETVGDLDFVSVVDEADAPFVAEAFCAMPGVARVLGKGKTKCSVVLQNGLQIDLRLVRDEQFPFALAHFTGSKEHNIVMRQRAIERGLKLNEYGLFRDDGSLVPCADETEIFAALDIPTFIPPELREDMGEFAAAAEHKLPTLVAPTDIRGIFHMHTTASDGTLTLDETVEHCIALGYDYIGITDHSQAAYYANGLSPARLREQIGQIAELNEKYAGRIVIFAGIEADILHDGSLDYDDELLAQLDFVIASVHSGFSRDEAKMTARVIRAIEHPATRILGHPTGRLLLERDGYPLDIEAVLQACQRTGTAVEINANPHRFDLDWRWAKRAHDLGVKIAINPDAHTVGGFAHTALGVGIARKGWLTRSDIINTQDAEAIRTWLRTPKK